MFVLLIYLLLGSSTVTGYLVGSKIPLNIHWATNMPGTVQGLGINM